VLKKTINFTKVYKRIVDRSVNSNLQKMANEIITDIVTRTQSGKDVNNKKFESYSPEYGKAKKKTHGSKVNLTVSGKMLNAITWKKIDNGLRFYVASKQERSKAVGNSKTRKFMGLDLRQRKRIAQKISKIRI